MIATRQRPKRRKLGKLLLPLGAIAALIVAFMWPPSHKVIVDGPLAPLWRTLDGSVGSVAGPLHFAAQQQQIADRNRDLEALNGRLEEQRKQVVERDKKISTLENQLKQAQQAATRAQSAPATPAPIVARAPRANAAAGPAAAGPAAAEPVTTHDDPKRIAQIWASMDAEKAAAVARRLPESYVATVFASMAPDAVGEIMGALPPDYAARVAPLIHK